MSEVLEQRERRLVGPVKIVENQHDRRLGRLLGQQRRHRLEEQEALGVGLSFRCLRKVGQALRELRQQARELCLGGDLVEQMVGRRRGDPMAESLDERLVGDEGILVERP